MKKNFETTLKELEKLISVLEEDELGLEEALKAYEQSHQLIQSCEKQLQNAQQRVQVLMAQQGDDGSAFDLSPFEAEI